MFNLFKKKKASLPAFQDLGALAAQATDETREKWLHFHRNVHLKEEVSLATKIDLFSQPLAQFFNTKYSQLLLGSPDIFWMAVFTAVLESGTHPKEQVNAAVEELRSKYGRR